METTEFSGPLFTAATILLFTYCLYLIVRIVERIVKLYYWLDDKRQGAPTLATPEHPRDERTAP